MSRIVFHIGYPKTGTTFLQKHVFSQVGALGVNSSVAGARAIDLDVREITRFSPSIWKTAYGQDLSRRIALTAPRSPILYSNEWFLNAPFFQPKWEPIRPVRWTFPAIDHLESFRTCAWKGNVGAIVTIRNQPELLASQYAERSGAFAASQEDFERRVYAVLNQPNYNGLTFLNYAQLIRELRLVLGADNVLVLFYEDLGKSELLESLSRFMGYNFELAVRDGQENVRREETGWRLRPRRIPVKNKRAGSKKWLHGQNWIRQVVNPALARVSTQSKHKIYISHKLRKDILESYNEYNLELHDLLGKNLDRENTPYIFY